MTDPRGSGPPTDQPRKEEFEPAADVMVYDFDDERTLDEEEAWGDSEDPKVEVSSLQKEAEMPLEELLAKYGCSGDGGGDDVVSSDSNVSDVELGHDGERLRGENEVSQDTTTELSSLLQLYPDIPMVTSSEPSSATSTRYLRSVVKQRGDDDEDTEYYPGDLVHKKSIRVGTNYQAVVPQGLFPYDDNKPYNNEDRLLWQPSRISEIGANTYLKKAQEMCRSNTKKSGKLPKDLEQALFILLQCNYNINEALRRLSQNSVDGLVSTECLWSPEERRNFEDGLASYGKDFYLIHRHRVRTRSVGELVQFYYLWKKTERHGVYPNKVRIEKKLYTMNSRGSNYAITQQSLVQRDRSSSPNVDSLIHADHKRHQQRRQSESEGSGFHTGYHVLSETQHEESLVELSSGSVGGVSFVSEESVHVSSCRRLSMSDRENSNTDVEVPFST